MGKQGSVVILTLLGDVFVHASHAPRVASCNYCVYYLNCFHGSSNFPEGFRFTVDPECVSGCFV